MRQKAVTAACFIILSLIFAGGRPAFCAEACVIVDKDAPNRGLVKVTGKGYAPAGARDAAQAKLMAKRAATVDGYVRLVRTVDNLSPSVENRGYGAARRDFLKGAKVLDTRYAPDGSAEVDLGLSVMVNKRFEERMEKSGCEVVRGSNVNAASGREITREEWEKLIDKGRTR